MAQEVYDAIVVGSGATGGWAAKELCEAGMKVLMLEAGRHLDPKKDFSEHVVPHQLPFRGRPDPNSEEMKKRPIGRRNYACSDLNVTFFIDEEKNPYTFPKDKPFWWIRANMVGGRSVTWARQSYRMTDYDFKAASLDGYGEDWPISYADIEPYYTKVEGFIGVSGRKEGLEILPDGNFLPPMALSCGEEILKKAVDGMGDGRRMTIGRTAVNTVRHQGRMACHYCGPCHRGCITKSYFSSPVSTLPAAEATGNFTLVPNAIVRHVTTNDKGLADGVFYFDKETNAGREVKAKAVVLCASTLESTRILLNSANDQYPNGLANSSGVLGHYLMDHMYGIGAGGTLPARKGAKPEKAYRPTGAYVPRFRNLKTKESNFIRGYGYQGGEGISNYEHAFNMAGFGAGFKQEVRDGNVSSVSMSGFGEMLPRKENRAYLDPEVRDAWDIPVLRVECTQGYNEAAMAIDIVEQAVAMLEAAGVENITTRKTTAPPGFGIHEVGTARMGNDPKKSVLNQFNQTHDIKNLFVTDGACYVTIGCVNPTITMMALTVRACEYLIDEHKRGNLA